MEVITPTTELEAINEMLRSIGESPVNSVENSGVVDAVTARQTLRSVSRRVQQKGWKWNTDEGEVLSPSIPDGFLYLPVNCLRVDTSGPSAGIDVVQRGNRLYDRMDRTYVFKDPVTVTMVVGLKWDELPEPARQYIFLAAARQFQENTVGSETLSTFNRRDEAMAWAALVEAEAENADYNILSDSWGVARVLKRTGTTVVGVIE